MDWSIPVVLAGVVVVVLWAVIRGDSCTICGQGMGRDFARCGYCGKPHHDGCMLRCPEVRARTPDPAPPPESGSGGRCQVCGAEMSEGVVVCRRCRTPHHLECWRYVGRCTTYGCAGREYDALRAAKEEVLVIRDDERPAMSRWAAAVFGRDCEVRSKDHIVWGARVAGLRCELHCLRLGPDWTCRFIATLDHEQEARVRRRAPPSRLTRSLDLNGVLVWTPLAPPADEAAFRAFVEACRAETAAAGAP